ncbi:CBS domain protein [Arenibacter algicola]|jgi:CBS domain containing-hemolysin-like protein|uniref:CBS domain protein n=1 Tax=Arenibacter algicola TaxID=616991 RepID=A0A221UX06_9FLAO|nr:MULTISPECIES: CBS domain-containing protein [Arenibacter]ASO05897.1 CBS domain protein [Arenibacter algicola]MDX1758907.1 CBS domain-containing protein [Arenibacter algicola]GBF20988.1 CBS domain protein [Arenibacter sp. NBRC 103722]|tara:strand:- start:145 stop:801 length:657 start_codon:yes stop_codon:yes gene_type:complete
MNIQNNIIATLPIFKVGDPLKKVIKFFNESTYSHVAVVEGNVFIGVLDENDLDNYEKDKKIEDYRYTLETFFVHKETSWLDVLEIFSKNEANLLPVLDNDGLVLGYYDLIDIVDEFIDTPFFTEPGGILVLAKGLKDYSFSEIAQIVESNNVKLIGGFITDIRNDVIQITIKIGTTHLNEIIQSFRRYNYTILYGNNDDQFIEDLKQRSDYLDKYLNV